jgi:hypothetical protein
MACLLIKWRNNAIGWIIFPEKEFISAFLKTETSKNNFATLQMYYEDNSMVKSNIGNLSQLISKLTQKINDLFFVK